MAQKEMPLVTIITPTYNRGDLLRETMESILSQDYPHLDYIVLDDGSQDHTVKILRKYKKITWDSHANMGPVKTINKGFSMAKGQILGIVNSDDPLKPGAVKNIVHFLMKHPEVGVVYPDWDLIDLSGKLIQHMRTYEYNFINMLRWHYCMPGPGTFFRRQVVEALGGIDPEFKYAFDYEFWLRAGLITQFARIPKSLAKFRQHSGALTSERRDPYMAEEHVRLIRKFYAHRDLPAEALAVKNEAMSSAYYVSGCVCADRYRLARPYYFVRAVMYAPLKYAGEYRHRLGTMLHLTFPQLVAGFRRVRSLLTRDPRPATRALLAESRRVAQIVLTDPRRAVRAIRNRINGSHLS